VWGGYRALLHGDGEHGEGVDALERGERRRKGDAHHVPPLHLQHLQHHPANCLIQIIVGNEITTRMLYY